MNLKSLVKDTAIYGLSSIVGRFLNYLLVPLYTYKIAASSGGYGIVTNLYAYTALFLAILTFGMETTLFRFANKKGCDEKMVFSTALRLVLGVGLVFLVAVLAFLGPISSKLGYASHPEYVGCFALITVLDAFQAIMFSRLRQQHKPVRFMLLKFAYIVPSIILNLLIFLVLAKVPAMQGAFAHFDAGVGFIFFANLLCTSAVTFAFIPEIKGIRYGFSKPLALQMLSYTWPLLILSLVGILNQVADKILFPHLMPGDEGLVQLGIYGACVKVAMIMALLTQAFRYAYEPIVFADSKDKNSPKTLSDGMTYFIVFTLLAYLAVCFYMPVLKYLVGRSYWDGLMVVPVVMAAEICMGVYFNLSFWYKLSDKTYWGAIISAIGAAVMIAFNVLMVPHYGYWACAWGGLAGYGVSMVLSFCIGQKVYPIKYDYKSIAFYVLLAFVLFELSKLPNWLGMEPGMWLKLLYNTLLLVIYCLPFGLKILRALRVRLRLRNNQQTK